MKEKDIMFEERYIDDAKLVVVSFGFCARIVKTAFSFARENGIKVGLIRPITLFPFPEKILKDASKRTKNL